MKKNWIINGILAALLLLLGLVAYYPEAPKEAAAIVRLQDYLGTETQAQSIEVRQHKLVRCRIDLHGNTWQLSAPTLPQNNDLDLNEFQLRRLLSLPQAALQPISLPADADLDKFGLAQPDTELLFNQVPIGFGNTHPLNHKRYLQVGKQVGLVDDQWQQLLDGCPESLISPELIDKSSQIERIKLPGIELWKTDERWYSNPAANEAQSMDILQAYLDEWRYARALYVSTLSAAEREQIGNRHSPAVVIHSANGVVTEFLLPARGGTDRLISLERGLIYHMHAESLAHLLDAPRLSSAEPKP